MKIYTKLYATFKVSNIEEIDTDFYKVEISDIRDDEFDIERAIKFGYDFSFCKGRKEYTFYFRFDYEYLYVLLEDKEHIFATYCLYDKDEYEALLEAIKTDNFEQYAFSFPRHADGTCDYDGIAEKPDIIAPGVIMTVKENQKLHSEDHATSEVRATLPAGKRVRFYEFGKEDTIDGITSNWMFVGVIDDSVVAIDSKVMQIYKYGWLFGGLVSDMEGMAELANAPATEYAKSAEDVSISKPAPEMGKTAVVTENLRLRTDDKTAAEVVATLAIGTHVKVLAPGREDTIDGIASNWVQVRVLDGAKDKNGNAIEAGTKGWLFGGYLSEAESAESERANEKVANVKKSSALPIVPIAAGGAALAVLLAVILLAAKKRKSDNK